MSEQFVDNSCFFEVKLDVFDGPIDLLLHLVKQNELPIEKVSLAQVAEQYLEAIEKMRSFDLEIAGEYLLIAATLVSIKSSMLLNEPVVLVEDADGNMVDPHEELLRRLREAQIYKEGAGKLGAMDMLGIDVFSAPAFSPKIAKAIDVELADHNPMLLGKAFRKLLAKIKDQTGVVISVEPISITERMLEMLEHLRNGSGKEVFYKLIPNVYDRGSIIASLIAMLELCKRGVVNVVQDESFDEIYIVLATADVNLVGVGAEIEREYDATVNF